jgi:thiol-disulfide isomerase/thioredoxin
MIAPIFQKLADKFPQISFLKVDVDQNQTIAARSGVSAMPTFQFYKNGKKIDEMKGANAQMLEQLIKKHGDTEGGVGGDNNSSYGIYLDLSPYIIKGSVDCLNKKSQCDIRSLFDVNGGKVESECDEQLLLNVPFSQTVKIFGLKIECNNMNLAPKAVKLFTASPNIGFEEAENREATQELELQEADYKKPFINLRFVKFQNVNNIAVFIKDNLSNSDVTCINRIVFIGTPIEATKDISALKASDK